ncbi:hypothetical protein [Sulfurimonas sp.]|uniref:hypothetical protein n=1 Tax=Sulfurimonas sp. TaxID=2022749 RepID=UPI003565A95D
MKTIYILLILLFISGCSSQNAFTYFDLNKEQQLSAQSFKRVKLSEGEKVIGTFSTIYLNEVYPNRFNKNEYFVVYIYMKDSIEDFDLKLNSHGYMKIKELNYDNRFSTLTREKSEWSKYYLVSFEEQGNQLNLDLYINNSKLASIGYKKNQQ